MAATLEKIYEVALHHYHMKLVAGREGLSNLVDWVHVVEEMDYVHFLKGRELIITTGIKEPDDAQLLEFTRRVYATGASGLVFNVGRYIRSVPKEVQEFGENNDFPVFVLPWEVHLVDFNRELCNLIYRSEQEQDDLESAFRKAVFSPEKKEEYLPVLAREGIHGDTGLTMVQCYVPASGKDRYYQLLLPLFKAVPADSYKTESDSCSLSSRQVSDSCDGGIPKRDCGSGAGCDETVCV